MIASLATDPGIPAALTTVVVALLIGAGGSFAYARQLRRHRAAERLDHRATWRREWLVDERLEVRR